MKERKGRHAGTADAAGAEEEADVAEDRDDAERSAENDEPPETGVFYLFRTIITARKSSIHRTTFCRTCRQPMASLIADP